VFLFVCALDPELCEISILYGNVNAST